MTELEKKEYNEMKKEYDRLEKEQDKLMKRMKELNDYIVIKNMSAKEFGEKWSEQYVRSKVPNLEKNNGSGHDLKSSKYELIELKSSTLDFENSEWTMNQLHVKKADAFLFIWYDCDTGDQVISFMTTKEVCDECTRYPQHQDDIDICCTIKNTKKNLQAMKRHQITSWDELNKVVV